MRTKGRYNYPTIVLRKNIRDEDWAKYTLSALINPTTPRPTAADRFSEPYFPEIGHVTPLDNPIICAHFSCARILTPYEQLFSKHCINHSKK